MNKKLIGLIISCIVLVGISFYAGTKISSSKKNTNLPNNMGQFGQNRNVGIQRGGLGSGAVGGEILSKDAESIVIKMRDGGSKIVFYTDKTTVFKTVDGTLSDLVIGKDVNIAGTPNSDGSINAQNISLRTAVPSIMSKN